MEEASNITSIMTASDSIAIFGADDNTKAGCGQYFTIFATGRQSIRTIVSEVQVPSASDHYFNTEPLIS